MATPTFTERLTSLVEPGVLLSGGIYHFAIVLLKRIFLRGELLSPILRMSQIRDEAFSKFWISFSGARDPEPASPVEPTGSAALIPPLLATANGIVLDLGPGTGTQTPLFTSPDLRKMYGAEPCLGLHADLRAKIASCGLADKYRILPCAAQPESLVPALRDSGDFSDAELSRGVFDTVVCVRVLCSVPRPEETVRGLYDLLKPGGKLIVVEHVVNPWTSRKGSAVGRLLQAVYTGFGWPFFVGDCNLQRDTEGTVRTVAEGDGGWESVDVERSFWWGPLPYISGTFVKKG